MKYGVLLFIPEVIASLLFVKHFNPKKTKTYTALWIAARVIAGIVMIVMTIGLVVSIGHTWDWGAIIGYTYQYFTDSVIKKPSYFAQYPNNMAWFSMLCVVGRIFKLVRPGFSAAELQILTSGIAFMLIQVSISFIYRAALRLWSRKKSFFVGIMTLLFLPFYLYAQYLYTDVPPLFCVSVVLYLFVRFLKADTEKQKVLFFILIGAVLAVSTLIKVTSVILLVAIVIALALSELKAKSFFALSLSAVVAFSCIFFPANKICKTYVRNVIDISDEMLDRYEFPFTHWIMMGLGTGRFNQDDVDYTASFSSFEEKKEANIQQIKTRLENYGAKGLVDHLLNKKLGNTFGNSCFFADHYLSKNPVNETLAVRFFSKNGDLHGICLYYSWTYHLVMLFGVALSAIASLKKKRSFSNKALTFARLCIFGFAIFMLIWECNSRYLLMFMPLMLFMCADGLMFLYSSLKGLFNKEKLK